MTLPAWVLAVNDGEAVEIARLLRARGGLVFCSRQPWGATWVGLEPEIREGLRQFRQADGSAEVIGIELGGPNSYGALNIDHHRYSGEDRSHPLSSLEQVAAKLGVPLDRRQQLVAANDRGFIPAMAEMGASREEMREVRSQDLAAQGVTSEAIAAQRQEVEAATATGGRYLVTSAFDPPTALSDILFLGKQAREWLIRGPHVWSYSGPRHRQMAALALSEPHWCGGRAESGYFGISRPGVEAQKKILQFFLA